MDDIKKDIISEARERFAIASKAEKDNRDAGQEDLRFLSGDQWDSGIKRQRDIEERPALVINLLNKFMRTVMGEQKLNRTDIQVHPRGEANEETTQIALLYEGLIRQITGTPESISAQENAFKYCLAYHIGYWRIRIDFSRDHKGTDGTARDFDKDIIIARIPNPSAVYFEPNLKTLTYEDAEYAFVIEDIPRDEYIRRYPNASLNGFDGDSHSLGAPWFTDEYVRVAEYWFKTHREEKLFLVKHKATQAIMSATSKQIPDKENFEILDERKMDIVQVNSVLMNGMTAIQKPKRWPGKFIPIIPVVGEELYVGGERKIKSLIRDGKDPQASYNYAKTCIAELLSQIPKSAVMGPAALFEGHERAWEERNKTSWAVLPYNLVTGHKPEPVPGPRIEPGLFNESLLAKNDVEESIGVFGSSFGKNTNERSGNAIRARQSASDTSVFSFVDAFRSAQMYCGKILVDLIPEIYDAERWIRIVGKDGTNEQIQVNQRLLNEKINDLSVGKYDIAMDVGPSFRTQRIEAVNAILDLARSVPSIGVVLADILVKNLDFPDSPEILARLQSLAQAQQQGAQQQETQGNNGGNNAGLPPEAVQALSAEQ